MKILHFGKYYWPYFGGIETAVQQLAEAGVALGHSVHVQVSQTQSFSRVEERINGVRITRLPTIGHLMSAPLSPYSLAEDADVLHVHVPHPVAELAVLKAYSTYSPTRLPRLMPYFHAFPVRQGQLGHLWFKSVTARIFDRAEAILISNPTIPEIFPQLKPWKAKFRTQPFATEVLERDRLEQQLPLRVAKQNVLAMGRLVVYKGYDVLIRAWSLMVQDNPNLISARLLITGVGPQWETLDKLRHEMRVEEYVSMLGGCTDAQKNEFLDAASIFVAPSINISETFGISILEAMARGLPVITTDLPTGVSILARGGDCGEVVKANDAEALAKALARLLQSPETQMRRGRDNHRFVSEHYTLENLRRCYKELLG